MSQNANQHNKKIGYTSYLLGCIDNIINFSIKILRLRNYPYRYLTNMRIRIVGLINLIIELLTLKNIIEMIILLSK
jgi:hypothetical protein